jgi:acrylyl-CoA reductase (NADPH)
MNLPAEPFAAIVLDRRGDQVLAELRSLTLDDLPAGEVLVEVAYSSVNYKDALAVTNRGRIVKGWPIVPGVDLAGTVVASASDEAAPGERVIVCGRGIGEEHWGGYSRYARVQAEWLIRLPGGMDLRQAMIIGTAGYTAMLAAMTLEDQGLVPGDGEVVVTGASGGVGSFAVAILSRAGHRVVASSGRAALDGYLGQLGAHEVIRRDVLGTPPARPMLSARWAGAVDTVGGETLASLIASMRRHGSIAACGLAGGVGLQTTVFPFILRGVNLMGVDSNYCPRPRRQAAFDRLAQAIPAEMLERIVDRVVPLSGVKAASQALLDGEVRGRVVVDIGARD